VTGGEARRPGRREAREERGVRAEVRAALTGATESGAGGAHRQARTAVACRARNHAEPSEAARDGQAQDTAPVKPVDLIVIAAVVIAIVVLLYPTIH